MEIERIGQTNIPSPLMAHAVITGADPGAALGLAYMCFTPWTRVTSLEEQVTEVFARLDEYLGVSGTAKARLLKAEVWLRNRADYEAFVPMWNGWIDEDNLPALAFSEAHLGRADVLVEIKVLAAR